MNKQTDERTNRIKEKSTNTFRIDTFTHTYFKFFLFFPY